jgi:6-phospho-beta-glucosidase
MARIKLTYIGGGSTRAPGMLNSLVAQGENFSGSEIVLFDLDPERLDIVCRLGQGLARARGLDLTIRATTDRRAALQDADAVLASFRPGGFEARVVDERVPLKHGLIGQETQGPGGFFMALRAIHVFQDLVADLQACCPRAMLFNYTNPINLVSQALTRFTEVPVVSLCEGPIIFPRMLARWAGLDPNQVQAVMVGLNHGSWSVTHTYNGQDLMPLIVSAYERQRARPSADDDRLGLRLLRLAALMESIPAAYFQYYYYKEGVLAELLAKRTTRAEDILARVPDAWQHYREQAASPAPALDPRRSRGGINELELAVDVMDAYFNDRDEVWPVNVPNRGALPDFPDDLVVEVPGRVSRAGIEPIPSGHLPTHVVGLVKMLGEYQWLAAEAAWQGSRQQAVRALASHPLCFSLPVAEAVYDELAAAHKDYLPDRLLW